MFAAFKHNFMMFSMKICSTTFVGDVSFSYPLLSHCIAVDVNSVAVVHQCLMSCALVPEKSRHPFPSGYKLIGMMCHKMLTAQESACIVV